ncbi:MAG: RNA polymerase sigma factor [Clostridiaceae bacterium]|jgi:RNA polymerase sigma-70 factor (ECF subfamily)|nr:RNA polymerase sigma factor [Clostridiaceae bacterium]
MADEKALIDKTLNGDVKAFEEIIELYKNKLFSFLVKTTHSGQIAEELLQEVFIRAYNNLDKYNDEFMFSTWIFRIALNICRSYMKKQNKLREMPINEELSYMEADGTYNPEEAYEKAELRSEIIYLINKLKEKQRIPLILKYVKGFSYFEIGNIMGISEEAARMRVLRAKENICRMYLDRHRSDWA